MSSSITLIHTETQQECVFDTPDAARNFLVNVEDHEGWDLKEGSELDAPAPEAATEELTLASPAIEEPEPAEDTAAAAVADVADTDADTNTAAA